MREKVNNNPLVQVALLAVLLLATGFFLMSSMGGGEEEGESGGTEATVTSADTGATATATGETAGEAVESAVESVTSEAGTTSVSAQPASVAAVAPPLPGEVTEAFAANQTVVLLFVRDGGIDDRLVRSATGQLSSLPDIALFVVQAGRISRYASITEGVGVDRVPALVVVRPKHLNRTVPTASVSYGFQSGQSVMQAVIDAGYRGPTVDYHP